VEVAKQDASKRKVNIERRKKSTPGDLPSYPGKRNTRRWSIHHLNMKGLERANNFGPRDKMMGGKDVKQT